MDISLLIEPHGSEPSESKKSFASVASVSTGATRVYTTAPLVHQPTSTKSMHGGPVLPAITKPHQQGLSSSNESPSQKRERDVSETLLAEESPAKKQSKWTSEEDNLTIELRGQGMKWDDIAERLPDRSPTSCRLRYQNYLEKRAVWDEEKKNTLARIYARFKDQMWQKVATEMGIPWRSAESMHWELGEEGMSARANAPMFKLHQSATSESMGAESTIRTGYVFLQHQPPRQTLAKTNPSGISIVSAPELREYKGDGREGQSALITDIKLPQL